MCKHDAVFRRLGKFRSCSIIGPLCWYSALYPCFAQTIPPASPPTVLTVNDKPLPDIATMMQAVEAHQKASEAIIKNYIYTSNVTETEVDGSGHPKKTETTEADIFSVAGARLRRVTKKNGKPLTPDEEKKETERIDREIAKAKERQTKGEPKRHDEVSYARFLELGTFSNERRVILRGRPTIAVDYTGDPKAKTHNPLEGAIHELSGTVWVDEQDMAMSRVEGHFANNFKIGGGLLINIAKDTSFWADNTKVNDEVWLPSTFAGKGSARVMVFFNMHGSASGTNSNYRKFKSGATILPNIQEVDNPPTPPDPSPQPQ